MIRHRDPRAATDAALVELGRHNRATVTRLDDLDPDEKVAEILSWLPGDTRSVRWSWFAPRGRSAHWQALVPEPGLICLAETLADESPETLQYVVSHEYAHVLQHRLVDSDDLADLDPH